MSFGCGRIAVIELILFWVRSCILGMFLSGPSLFRHEFVFSLSSRGLHLLLVNDGLNEVAEGMAIIPIIVVRLAWKVIAGETEVMDRRRQGLFHPILTFAIKRLFRSAPFGLHQIFSPLEVESLPFILVQPTAQALKLEAYRIAVIVIIPPFNLSLVG